MKKILFVGAEAMPFAATGGLGDVLGSLPAAIKRENEEMDIRVVIPYYASVESSWGDRCENVIEFYTDLSWRRQYCGVKSIRRDGVIYYFIDNRYYYMRDGLYGSFDDGERFAFFCKAAVDMLRYIDFFPDIIHANDWQSALGIVYLKTQYSHMEEYAKIKTVFTIHNIEYQGKYDMESLGGLFGLGDDARGIMEYDGCINLMKAAIVCADVVTTVSPRYAQEILTPEYSHGLDRILNPQGEKLCGILNGIDYKLYDPAKDSDISINFTWRSFGRKRENKLALQRELGLPEREDIPLLSVISRLASHKGLDLIREKIYNILGEKEIQLVVLGKGEPLYENFFIELENSFPSSVRALILYDRLLSKRIYAATDIFLMPSRSEPCGLSQMIASRYGAIPIVRATGGLYDSIKPYRVEGNRFFGNGFTFDEYSSEAFKESVLAAIELWYDEEKRYKLAGRIMRTDFSWQTSAREYIKMYEKL